jgi:hypothetical protein
MVQAEAPALDLYPAGHVLQVEEDVWPVADDALPDGQL